MSLIRFQDAVTAANIQLPEQYATYYMDGIFENHGDVAARLPNAKLFAITVRGATGPSVFACDCEVGDLSSAQAVAWVEEQIRLNVKLICVYANLSTWSTGLTAALGKYGKRVKRWVAHFDGVAVVPKGFDAKQYATGNVDRDVALSNFFVPVIPKPDVPHGHARFEGTVDIGSGKIIGIHGVPGLGVHFTGVERWLPVNVELQVGRGGGHWRAKP